MTRARHMRLALVLVALAASSASATLFVTDVLAATASQFEVLAAPGLGSAYANEVLADGPVAYYRLGESSGTTMVDQTGVNNGTYVGGVTLSQLGALPSDPDTAAQFNGSTGRASTPDSASLDRVGAVSVEAWAKRTRSGVWQVVVGKPGVGQSKGENYAIWFNPSNRAQAYFGNGTTYVTVISAVLDANWHHIVATYDNAVARLYIDGIATASAASTVALTPNNKDLNVARGSSNQNYFGGTLDEIAVYPTALSAARIQAHYAATTADAPPLVTLTQPANGSSTNSTTPPLSGTAGTAAGDSTTVTARIYAGTGTSGTLLQTLNTTRDAGGAYSVNASALAPGTYTARAEQTDDTGNTGYSSANTFTIDTQAPSITLTNPANGSSPSTASPTFSGTAGTTSGDSTSVTVRIYTGSTPSGTPVQTLNTTRAGDGSYSVTSASLATGTYTARAQQSDAAGNTGLSNANTFTITVSAPDPVLIGAGDIAGCESGDGDAQTAAVINQYPNATVFTLGDNAYINGQPSEYTNCYGPTWGQFKSRTRPITGDHDTATVSGGALPNQGFVNYFSAQLAPFGPTATDRLKAYYSYDIGAWHVVALNSPCYQNMLPGCDPAAQEQWFRNDLASHQNVCTAVLWHNTRWSSGNIHGNATYTQPLWAIAYEGGADIVLSGNEHDYERFAPQDANGALDNTYGVRQFVVGTGGYYLYSLGTRQPNSEAYSSTYGVTKLTLHATSYDWQFLPIAGQAFTDSGSGNCHGAPSAPSGTPTVRSQASASAPFPSPSLTIGRPAGTVAGDLLVATVAHQGGSAVSLTPPSGWSAVPNSDFYEGTNARLHAWYKVAGASEPSTYTFTLTSGSGQSIAGGVMAITGAATSSPINASGGQVIPSNVTLLTAPSITTTKPNTALIYAGAVNTAVTFTPPQLMPEQWDLTATGTYKVATETAVGGVAAAGATGTRSATLSSASRGVAIAIAVAPAP